jgi:hypothetical protein
LLLSKRTRQVFETDAKANRHPELTEQTIWDVFEAERPRLIPYAGRFDGFHAVPACEMGFASAGPADQHGIALLGDEAAAGQVADERLVDRRAFEPEVVDILGERKLGDGELVFDRARLLLADLGGEQIADNDGSTSAAREQTWTHSLSAP